MIMIMDGHGRATIGSSYPYNAGTEYVGFSPTGQTLLAPSASLRGVFGGGGGEGAYVRWMVSMWGYRLLVTWQTRKAILSPPISDKISSKTFKQRKSWFWTTLWGHIFSKTRGGGAHTTTKHGGFGNILLSRYFYGRFDRRLHSPPCHENQPGNSGCGCYFITLV